MGTEQGLQPRRLSISCGAASSGRAPSSQRHILFGRAASPPFLPGKGAGGMGPRCLREARTGLAAERILKKSENVIKMKEDRRLRTPLRKCLPGGAFSGGGTQKVGPWEGGCAGRCILGVGRL